MSETPTTTTKGTTTMATKFEQGKTYEVRSICDYECIFRFTVVKRTAKFITVTDSLGGTRRVKVREWDGAETALPLGSYSMAPMIRADRERVSRP